MSDSFRFGDADTPHHMRGQLAHDAALKSGGVHPIIGADRDTLL